MPDATASDSLLPHSKGSVLTASATPAAKGKRLDIDEHLMSFEEVVQKHKTSFNANKPAESSGLTDLEAKARLAQHGPNILTPVKSKPAWLLFLECFGNLFNILLLLCCVFTFILVGIDPVANRNNIYVGAILFGVILFNSILEFLQLRSSANTLKSFLNMIPAKCNVIRDGNLIAGSAAELVLGDIVFVRMGDKVPADLYIFHASDLKVDNSSLTGEAEPQDRSVRNTHENPLEATNLAFNGTLAVSGECYGVVIQTGDRTVLGQIASMTQGEKKRESPLSMEINRFVKIISTLAISSSIIFFAIAQWRFQNIRISLNFAIGVLVAWVPQGLPTTVTMLLTIASKRMAQKQVLVKDLQGVETLGAITLLATDKTGTLTRNQMTVTNLWCSLKMWSASTDARGLPSNESPYDPKACGVPEILNISALCTRARYDRTDVPIDQRNIIGDATESGLFKFAGQKITEVDYLSEKYPKVFEIPFNSDTKWHMTIHKKSHANGSLTLFMKGAPERILRVCSTFLVDGSAIPLTDQHKKAFQEAYEYLAGKGHRVLAFAQLLMPESEYPVDTVFDKEQHNYPTSNLCFVGLASLEDPPKHGVREAIGHCREAGVKVMMVTGDHPLTAEAIGRKINLMISDTKEKLAKKTGRPIENINEEEVYAIVIHGERIDSLTDADWDLIFSKDEIIFARTSPKHKLQIVKRAQSLGHIVGVTGDGVNDSPALKKADLGIAMNQSGSDVSKEAAAMILLDDNFASTVHGISEGRLIFSNLKKSIKYVLTHMIPEVMPYLLNVVVPVPLALSPIQILVIDLGFELIAALSYAYEPPESKTGLMKLAPRRPVTPESIQRLRLRDARQAKANERNFKTVDPETGERAPVSGLRRHVNGVKRLFTTDYWKDAFAKPDGEILVDGPLLSWSILEVAMIEFVGCMTTFFVVLWLGGYRRPSGEFVTFGISPYDSYQMASSEAFEEKNKADYTTLTGNVLTWEDRREALAQGQSSYYMGMFIIQMFNMFACKCRMKLPFGKHVLINRYTWVSVLVGALFVGFIVYTPPLNVAFGTSYQLLPLYWLIPMAFGSFVLLYVTIRFYILKKLMPMTWGPEIEGLQMYPTKWSTGR